MLPCDDDDWFRPDVAAVVERAVRPGTAGRALAQRASSRCPTRLAPSAGHLAPRRCRARGRQFLCTTNNYALFASEDSKER